MKAVSTLALLLGCTLCLQAQIDFDTFSDFEDGTTQGWRNGNNSPNPPTVIETGGPNGADDAF